MVKVAPVMQGEPPLVGALPLLIGCFVATKNYIV